MSPDIPPEAEVIRLAREAMDMTAQSAAEASRAHDGKGVSAAYWRDIERGYGGRRGQRVPTRASDRALAAMARVVGVTPPQLTGAGRDDAARVLGEILRREEAATPPPDASLLDQLSPELKALAAPYVREIRARAEVAADMHPGVPLEGRWVFPLDTEAAKDWDATVATGLRIHPGQGWTTAQVVEILGMGRMVDAARGSHSGGAAAG